MIFVVAWAMTGWKPLHVPRAPHHVEANLLIIFIYKYSSSSSLQALIPKSQKPRRHRTQPHHKPAGPNNLLVLELPPRIPHQMPYTIEAVERKEKRQHPLDRHLDQQRHRSEPGNQAARLEEVQSQKRLHEVAEPEYVEGAREHAARDPVQARGYPCYLRPVDAQVRRDGPVQALLDEDIGALLGGDVRGCCGESGGERERSD